MTEPLSVLTGRRVRSHREYLGLTREQLAEKSDLSVQFLSDIELGKKNMSTKSLFRVSQALSLSADYILFGGEAGAGTPKLDEMLTSLSEKDRKLAEDILKSFVKAVKNK